LKGAAVVNGSFAENITNRGIDPAALPVGTRLFIGTTVLEISQIGKQCHRGCEIMQQVGDCIMPKRGVFAIVIKEGFDISRLAEKVGEKEGVKADELRKRTKDKAINDVRKIFCYFGSKVLEMPKSELGKYLGISTPGVWRLAQEGKKVVEKRGIGYID
jgi:hypothetical protein